MATRRILMMAALLGSARARAQSAGQPPPAGEGDGLRNRGAPTGRVGGATRGERDAQGGLALDLVAPLRGIGLTATDQPTLFFLLSAPARSNLRLAISTRGQARPLASLELPRSGSSPGLHAVRLAELRIRLPPEALHTWSVSVPLDPHAPSRDLVASALIQHRVPDGGLAQALRQASPDRLPFLLAETDYWYDAVALAERQRPLDRGAALAALFARIDLPPPPPEILPAGARGQGRG